MGILLVKLIIINVEAHVPVRTGDYNAWCWTSMKDWAFCRCPGEYTVTECIPGDSLPHLYSGNISTSESGQECIKWEDAPDTYDAPFDGTDHNKCRGPQSDKAWCWIRTHEQCSEADARCTDEWEYCLGTVEHCTGSHNFFMFC